MFYVARNREREIKEYMTRGEYKGNTSCGSVGRVVATSIRSPQFESSHLKNYIEHLFPVCCITEMTKIRKRARQWLIFKQQVTIKKTKKSLKQYFTSQMGK